MFVGRSQLKRKVTEKQGVLGDRLVVPGQHNERRLVGVARLSGLFPLPDVPILAGYPMNVVVSVGLLA
ncbi:hypothetical protein RRG08_043054 [Elysia crispata]|uniref:Uncharacterized protein n=1 Tax=Elysia crispata TaxID=231223 RepID=A0AAE0XY53_9GAST|nr:hypothetical protein RRG08_043054 [Elysia crispata]